MAFYRCVPYKKQSDDLPSGYTRLKYLESGGRQYINSGKTLSSNSVVVLKFSTSSIGNVRYHFLGGYDSSDLRLQFSPSNPAFIGLATSYSTDIILGIDTTKEHTAEFSIPDQTVSIDGVIVYTAVGKGFYSDDIAIFTTINKGEIKCDNSADTRIHEFKIAELGVMLISCIPSLDISGKPCMYDTVSKQTLYNLGTGEFGYELMDGTYVAPI